MRPDTTDTGAAPFPRTTVLLTFLMENWSEGTAPPYSPMTSPPKPGTVDRAGIQWSTYGGSTGIARLMQIATDHGVAGTVCINARSAELFPETVQHIVESGFDIGAHNYAQDEVLSGLDEKEERALIGRSLKILKDISGVEPSGWLSSTLATTENTADIVAGHKLLWHGDYNYLDQPQIVDTTQGPVVAIPHSDYADNRVLRGAPKDWFDCYKDMFDYLYRRETGSLINITMHGNFGGRPLMAAQLDKLLSHIKAHHDVWMPRHDELAHWVNKHQVRNTPFAARFARKLAAATPSIKPALATRR
jgi:peptidoglycan/xylan/chitin deacetylase (PgdA/CDA1 family)